MAKVALVSAHFMPEVGYQEVQLANAFARLGHEIEVFSSTAISPSAKQVIQKPYESGRSQCERHGYYINRVKPIMTLASNVWARGIKKAVLDFGPDYIVMVGMAKMFGLDVFKVPAVSHAKMAAVFSEAAEYIQRKTFKQKIRAFVHDTMFALMKKRVYRKAVRSLNRVVLNTPETEKFFRDIIRPDQTDQFECKKLNLRLGFDPAEFSFDESSRNQIREMLGIPNESLVAMTSTRVLPSKQLEKIVESVSKIHERGVNLHYVLTGFLEDDYGTQLKRFIANQPKPELFHSFGFLSHSELTNYYSASDIGIWLKAAISIQEAMGTGLPVLLENRPIVQHLIQDGKNGWFYDGPETFEDGLEQAVNSLMQIPIQGRLDARRDLQRFNASFLSYDVIAQEILDSLKGDFETCNLDSCTHVT